VLIDVDVFLELQEVDQPPVLQAVTRTPTDAHRVVPVHLAAKVVVEVVVGADVVVVVETTTRTDAAPTPLQHSPTDCKFRMM
jgi:hypothetical protein